MSETTPQTERTHPLLALWQQHTYAEFVTKDVEAALATMTEDAHVLLIPVGTGGRGKDAVRTFYATSFIPHIPLIWSRLRFPRSSGATIWLKKRSIPSHTICPWSG